MTKEERVEKTIDRIEAELRKLEELTNVYHISAVLIGDSFMIDDYQNLGCQKFSVFRKGGKQ